VKFAKTKKNMLELTQTRARKWTAVLCLMAVILLQAPFAQAAWISNQMACCTDGKCAIPSHHHKTAPPKDDKPMNCGHDMNQVSECKMSCCKTMDETAINVESFIVPYSAIILATQDQTPGISHFAPQMISRSYKPQSPPPKFSLS
jgi:hypothetical protein